MTTIGSDSESQDSDEGRRFRFEATRKDDALRLQSQNKRKSDLSKSLDYRSRSEDRNSHKRRDYDKAKQDRDRKESSDRDRQKSSKEKDFRDSKYDSKSNSKESRHTTKGNSKDCKETDESKASIEDEKRDFRISTNHREFKNPVRNSSNSKDYRNSKDSRSRESKNTNTRALKDTKIREGKDQDLKSQRNREIKDNRDRERERGPKRSRNTNHDRISMAKHSHKSGEKYKSRERSGNREKVKLDGEKPKEEQNKNVSDKRSPRKGSERKNIKQDAHSPSKILDQIGSDSESDLGTLDPDIGSVMALDTLEDCREMNLSDFEIISDTEGSSSSGSPDANTPAGGPIIKGEILSPHYYGPKITKRVSRRQYERLVRRQAALTTRRLEELYKVKRRNNDEQAPLAPSNNNPDTVSDFLLGPETSELSAVREHRRRCKREGDMHDDSEDHGSKDKYKLKENDNENPSNCQPSQIENVKLAISNHHEKKSTSNEKSSATDKQSNQQLLDDEIYGPRLPPKSRKDFTLPENTNCGESLTIHKEVWSPSRDIGSSCSHEKTFSIALEKNLLMESRTQRRHRNPERSLPLDPSFTDVLNKDMNKPRSFIIGPSLPPVMWVNSKLPHSESEELQIRASDSEAEQESVSIIGPSLPPHHRKENSNFMTLKAQDSTPPQQNNSIFGPTLPLHLMPKVSENSEEQYDSDSEDEVLGPMPADHPAAMNDYIQQQLEERANRMKSKLDAKNSVIDKREEWMLELPSAQAINLGLSKRQFRSKAGPDMSDRSSWTDTPADKAKKKQEKLSGKGRAHDASEESERLAIQERDRTMEKMAEKHASKRRKESLLEIHKKKLHKKKKKAEKETKETDKPSRRPFDRDIDLQANRFDEVQKKSILNKAQLLNDRFSRGESKYL